MEDRENLHKKIDRSEEGIKPYKTRRQSKKMKQSNKRKDKKTKQEKETKQQKDLSFNLNNMRELNVGKQHVALFLLSKFPRKL
jgi:hypothetical protein